MAEYAIVDNDVIVEYRQLDQVPVLNGKPYRRIVPVVITSPSFDSSTQVRTGPVVALEADRVTRTWNVRAKTAQELTADIEAQKDRELAALQKAIFEGFFVHENRLRVLEGQPPVTRAQLLTWFRSQV